MTLEKYIVRVKEQMNQENTYSYIAEYKELKTLRYILPLEIYVVRVKERVSRENILLKPRNS
jgi:hypothetical protein